MILNVNLNRDHNSWMHQSSLKNCEEKIKHYLNMKGAPKAKKTVLSRNVPKAKKTATEVDENAPMAKKTVLAPKKNAAPKTNYMFVENSLRSKANRNNPAKNKGLHVEKILGIGHVEDRNGVSDETVFLVKWYV